MKDKQFAKAAFRGGSAPLRKWHSEASSSPLRSQTQGEEEGKAGWEGEREEEEATQALYR